MVYFREASKAAVTVRGVTARFETLLTDDQAKSEHDLADLHLRDGADQDILHPTVRGRSHLQPLLDTEH